MKVIRTQDAIGAPGSCNRVKKSRYFFFSVSIGSYTEITFRSIFFFRFLSSVIHFSLNSSRYCKLSLRVQNWIRSLCNIHLKHFTIFFFSHSYSSSFFLFVFFLNRFKTIFLKIKIIFFEFYYRISMTLINYIQVIILVISITK